MNVFYNRPALLLTQLCINAVDIVYNSLVLKVSFKNEN